ncbi:hypothetical protein ACFL6X_08075, partial [Candidatus Latescibacterota bacterium]
ETPVIPEDRRVVWKDHVGIPGGIPPRTTICATIDASYGNGTADATSAIQSALDACGDDQVVRLPPGTFRLTDTVRLPSHRVLRGAGPEATTISFDGPTNHRSAIALSGSARYSSGTAPVAIVSGASKGSTTITVADGSGVEAGDIMLVDQLNDGDLVSADGVQGTCRHCGRDDGDRTMGQLVEITGVIGDQVWFSIPLYWTYRADLSPEASFVPRDSYVRWSGVEDLKLTQPAVSARYLVEMQATQHCWLKNVEVERVDWRAVWMLKGLQNEIRDSYFHESINGYGRSHGYGVLVDMFSSANLVENNVFHTLDGGLMMTGGGAAGNVFGYNYGEDSRFDDIWWLTGSPSINHAPHPMMNLWEGNVGYMISGDFIWGSSSHNTVYRSRSHGWQREETTANNNAVQLATKNSHVNVVGCVLGTAGRSTRYEVLPGQPYDNGDVAIWHLGVGHGVDDAQVAATLLRHGNYDYVNDDTVWDPRIASRALPPSLYLEEKPAWFGAVPWPPIGPDVEGLSHRIPAQLRFESETVPASSAPLPLESLTASAHTGDKPQSKVWHSAGCWWAVLPDTTGTWIWRLDGTAWRQELRLAPWTDTFADVLAVGDSAHVLLYRGEESVLVSACLTQPGPGYRPLAAGAGPTPLRLEPGGETATIDLDGAGRMWLASDTRDKIVVRWADPPYTRWQGPHALAEGVAADDICLVRSLPDGSVAVLWSNQNTRHFGFRTHAAGADPTEWTPDERPAAHSAQAIGDGMADDHLNVAVGGDGTLYAAVKTSYDTPGYPLVALLVRHPDGVWDPLHGVDDEGSRGIVLLDDEQDQLVVVYSSYRDGQLVCRRSPTGAIAFGPRQVLMRRRGINNATSARQRVHGSAVVMAGAGLESGGTLVLGVRLGTGASKGGDAPDP